MTNSKKPENEEFVVRSKLECLYVYLGQLTQEELQNKIDIIYWQKMIVDEPPIAITKQLEMELEGKREKAREYEVKLRGLNNLIAEEKATLNKDELAGVLAKVKLMSVEDMTKSVIDFFTSSLVPYEVDLKFWESKSLEPAQPEVKTVIQTRTIPYIKNEIKLRQGGKRNAELYLQHLIAEREGKEKLAN